MWLRINYTLLPLPPVLACSVDYPVPSTSLQPTPYPRIDDDPPHKFLLDRPGRYIKLFVSTVFPSSVEFAKLETSERRIIHWIMHAANNPLLRNALPTGKKSGSYFVFELLS